jgi:hypothetical protein
LDGRAVIDRCGFELALNGVRPRAATLEGHVFDEYILPLGEYRAFLQSIFSIATGQRGDGIFPLLAGAAGQSQPRGLTLGAAAQIGLPGALHDISVILQEATAVDVLDEVRLSASLTSLQESAQYVAAAVRARCEVLACGAVRNLDTIAALKLHGVRVHVLEHTCRVVAKKGSNGDAAI